MKNVFFIKTGKSVKEGGITPNGILTHSNDGDIIILNDSNILSMFYTFYQNLQKLMKEKNERRTFIPGLDVYIEGKGQVTLVPKNNQGLITLYNLHEVSFKRNQDEPYLNIEDLIALDKLDNVYMISGGNNSIVYNMINNKDSLLKKQIKGMKNFIIGIDDHRLYGEQDNINMSIRIAKLLPNPPILKQNFLCNQKEELIPLKRINEAGLKKQSIIGDFNYSLEEASDVFNKYEQFNKNSYELFKNLKVDILDASDYGYYLPKFATPDNSSTESFFLKLINDGLKRIGQENNTEYWDRIDEEYGVISAMGFIDYFLIYWDLFRFCKEEDIMTGPGRGSAAGSLIAYLIGITKIDPIKLGLLFERFLNFSRLSMPDIDADFPKSRRDDVIAYVVNKYGEDKVSKVITFGLYQSKNSIEDMVRTKGLPLEVSLKLKSALGDIDLEKYMAGTVEAEELDELLRLEAENHNVSMIKTQVNGMWTEVIFSYREILEEAVLLVKNQVTRNFGQHPSAIIVSDRTLSDIAPMLTTGKTNDYTLGLDGVAAEARGSLKLDILALKTLDVLKETLDNVDMTEEELDYKSDYDTVDLNILPLLQSGMMTNVFQFEKDGMRSWIKVLFKDFNKETPSTTIFNTLSALCALYRPGPMDSIPQYVENLANEDYTVFHPIVKDILKPTHGILVYQEQVMNMSELFGFTKLQKDELRAAIAKKKEDKLAQLKPLFIQGAIEKGVDEKSVTDYWDNLIIPFGDYAFNKSHADCYANIALKTLVLKHYYPATYYAAALNSAEDSEQISATLAEAKIAGIKIDSPKLTKCYAKAVGDENTRTIYISLKMIKNVSGAAQAIADTAAKSKNFIEFYINSLGTSINSRVFNNLITVGFFDEEKPKDVDKLEFRQSLLFHIKTLLDNKDARSVAQATAAINLKLEQESIEVLDTVKYKLLKKDAKALEIDFDQKDDYVIQYSLEETGFEMIEDYAIKVGLNVMTLNEDIKNLLIQLKQKNNKIELKDFVYSALEQNVKINKTSLKKLINSELVGNKRDVYIAEDFLNKHKAYFKAQEAIKIIKNYKLDFNKKANLSIYDVRDFEFDCFGMYISFPTKQTGIIANLDYTKRIENQQKKLTIMSVENKTDSFNNNEPFQAVILTDGIVQKRAKIKDKDCFITKDKLHSENIIVTFASGNMNGNEYITIKNVQ